MSALQLILGDKSPEMIDAWQRHFAGVSTVTTRGGNLLLASADALVSPANSFGFMDGGIDWAISDLMEWKIHPIVQTMIAEKYDGEIPVGMAEVVPTGFPKFPYLVCVPTMRVPHDVSRTVNAFLATRAALLAVLRYNAAHNNPITSIAFPGMATGYGKMPSDRCAKQMRAAYDEVLNEKPKYRKLAEAIHKHKELLE